MGWGGMAWHGMAWHGMAYVANNISLSLCELSQKASVGSLGTCAAPDIATRFSHLSFCSRSNLLLYHNRPRGISDPHLWLSSRDLLSPHSLVNLVIL